MGGNNKGERQSYSPAAIEALPFGIDTDSMERDADEYAEAHITEVVNEFSMVIDVLVTHGRASKKYGRM